MKKVILGLSLALLFGFLASQAKATVLADWTFEGLPSTYVSTSASPGSAASPGPTAPFAADSGTLASSSFATGLHATTTSAWSSPAGNGSPRSLSANNWTITGTTPDYFQFSVPGDNVTTNYYLTADVNGSSTGPKNFELEYAIDNGSFNNLQAYSIPSGITWSAATNFPASTVLVNVAVPTLGSPLTPADTITFRMVDTSTTSIGNATVGTAGTSRVDNVIISDAPVVVPEPAAFAIAGLGLIGLLSVIRLRKRTQAA